MQVLLSQEEYEELVLKAARADELKEQLEAVKNRPSIGFDPLLRAENAQYTLSANGNASILCKYCGITFTKNYYDVQGGEVECPSCKRKLWLW